MIKFDGAGYRYPSSEATALENLTFQLEEGSFHFMCGPSGAGKTTIFRMLYMDLVPSYGALQLFGRNTSELSRDEIAHTRRRMGVVFQDAKLLDHLTVHENVSLPLCLHGKPTREQQKGVDEILEWVGLADKAHVSPNCLSGGERQRVGIARAVVNRPKLLIADEPTGNVDEVMGKRIMHLFSELNKHGTTILIATHDRNMVRSFKLPCLYIEGGKLIREVA